MNLDIYQQTSQLEKHHWWFVARRKILKSLIQKIQPSKELDILEIGAGTGGNLDMLMEFGNVSAVEPNQFAQSKIKEKFSNIVTLFDGKLPEELNLHDKKFDLICLFDVLEHIEDDRSSVRALQKILNPGGKIIITLPAFQSLWSPHDEAHHHFRRYNISTFKELIKESGLKITRISYFNFLLFPLAIVARMFKKGTLPTNQIFKPSLLNTLLTLIFSSEKLLLSKMNLPFGLSLFCILEKK